MMKFKDIVGARVQGYITAPRSMGGDFTNYPDWWMSLAVPVTQWRRGHLLAKEFGGAGGSDYRNLAPIYFLVNNSAMATCENRIRSAVDCGHCVTYTVRAIYPNALALLPSRLELIATSPQGLNINVSIDNVRKPAIPIACSPTGPNASF